MGITRELDEHFCTLLNGWHALEQTLQSPGIVDFNLPEWKGTRFFQRRKEILHELEEILADPASTTDRHFYQRVYGLRIYMLDLLNDGTTDIDEYLPATMGFKSVHLPEEYVLSVREQTKDSLAKVGVSLEKALTGLAEKTRIVPAREIPSWFRTHFATAVEKAKRLCPDPVELPEPEVSVYYEDSMTLANITGIGNRLSVKFNEKLVKERSEESLQNTLRHEILGHGVQIALWHHKIHSKEWNMHRGMTCMQGIESFQMESLAEYASVYYSDNDVLQKADSDLSFYRRVASCNMNDMILRGVETDERLRSYYLYHMPYRDDNFAQRSIDIVRSSSLRRCYSSVYGPALRLSTHIMESLDGQGQAEFMRRMYEGYMDATDMQELGMGLGVPKLDYFEPARPAMVQAVADIHPQMV